MLCLFFCFVHFVVVAVLVELDKLLWWGDVLAMVYCYHLWALVLDVYFWQCTKVALYV